MFVFNPIRKSVLNFDIGQTGQTGGQQYSDASHYELSDYSLVINSSNDACRKLTWLLKNSEDFAYGHLPVFAGQRGHPLNLVGFQFDAVLTENVDVFLKREMKRKLNLD